MDTNNHRLIFLIGYMGSGKTTLGKKLAQKLDYTFIDLDHILEAQTGMTIANFFSVHGETEFRKLESSILKELKYPARAVVSTGGGLPCFFDNMEWMNAHGHTVYIKLTPAALVSRLQNNKDERPILRDKHGEELLTFITEKLAERETFYNRAKIIAEGLSLTAERLEALLLH